MRAVLGVVAFLIVTVSACRDLPLLGYAHPNAGPEPSVAPLPDTLFLGEGETRILSNVTQFFSDPDRDPLFFSGESSDTTVATISFSEQQERSFRQVDAYISAVGAGEVVVSLIASEPPYDPTYNPLLAPVELPSGQSAIRNMVVRVG